MRNVVDYWTGLNDLDRDSEWRYSQCKALSLSNYVHGVICIITLLKMCLHASNHVRASPALPRDEGRWGRWSVFIETIRHEIQMH